MSYIGTKPADQVLDSTLIADGTITSSKIVDGTITNSDISASAAIATSKITGLSTVATSGSAADLSTGTLAKARLPTGCVLQVVQSVLTTMVTGSNNTWTNISSASITPSSSSSKILVLYSTNSQSGGNETLTRLLRGGTTLPVYTGGDVSFVGMTMGSFYSTNAWGGQNFSMTYLDSPATTSSTTYYLQGFQDYQSLVFNRSNNTNTNDSQGGITTITLMEIAA